MIDTILLTWPPKQLSSNARTHWAVKASATKTYRAACGWRTKAQIKATYAKDAPVSVNYTFFPPDTRHRDEGNMISAFKAGQDGIADAIGVDDRHFRCTYSFGKPHRPHGAIQVTITQEG